MSGIIQRTLGAILERKFEKPQNNCFNAQAYHNTTLLHTIYVISKG